MSCPHPEKRRYDTKAQALDVIRAMYRHGDGNPDLNAYQCPGGNHWHVGHNVKHFTERIQRSIRGGRGSKTLHARNRRRKR